MRALGPSNDLGHVRKNLQTTFLNPRVESDVGRDSTLGLNYDIACNVQPFPTNPRLENSTILDMDNSCYLTSATGLHDSGAALRGGDLSDHEV